MRKIEMMARQGLFKADGTSLGRIVSSVVTITEVGTFNDEWPVGRLTRVVFDEPIHCEEVADGS